MKKIVLFFMVLALLGTIGLAGLAWSQGTVIKKLLPQPRLPGPDLKVLDYNIDTRVIRVINIGSRDAVFPQGGLLLSYSEPGIWASQQQHGQVPPGGRITPGQIISIEFSPYGPEWYCPADPTASLQYGYFNYIWPYALPRPVDAEGRWMLLVDPDGKVAETDETNNTYQFTRPNPYVGVIQGTGAPDLLITKIEVSKVPSANGQYINVYIKNVGTKTAYSCGQKFSNSAQYTGLTYLHGYVDGSDHYCERGSKLQDFLMIRRPLAGEPFVLQPGEERLDYFFLTDEVTDSYGVSNGGLKAVCHELKLVLDPLGQVPGERSCNNTTTFYFASGNATCDPNKVMTTSPCMQLQVSPQPEQPKGRMP